MSTDSLELAAVFSRAAIVSIFGLMTAYIARLQYGVTRWTLNLDIFERRFRIYSQVRRACANAVRKLRLLLSETGEVETLFAAELLDFSFLFGPEVEEFIQEVMHKWMDLSNFERQLRNDPEIYNNEERRGIYHCFHNAGAAKIKPCLGNISISARSIDACLGCASRVYVLN